MAGQLDENGMLLKAPNSSTINNGIVTPVTPVPVLPQPDYRSSISTTQQPGYIQGYDTNNNYNPVFVPKGQYVPGISATPKQMTTDSLNPASTIKLPAITETNGSGAGAIVAGADQTMKGIMEQLSLAPTDAELKQNDFLNQMAGLKGEQGKRGADQLTAEQGAGLPGLKTQFSQINSQILSKIAEANSLDQSYQADNTAAEGNSGTLSRLQGAQGQNYRMYLAQKNAKASEIGLLQAQAQGLQGQIQTAQDTANRSIDLKYSTIDSQLKTYEAQLAALMPTLNKEEKLQAQAQQVLLDRQKQELMDKKQKEKDIQDTMLAYIQAGGKDQGVMAKISASQNNQQALQILGANKPPETQVVDLGNRKVLINSQSGQAIRDLGAIGKVGSGGSSSNPLGGNLSPGAQAVADNPSLLNNYTATEKGKIINELSGAGYDTNNLGTKPLSDAAIKEITQSQEALMALQDLKGTIAGKSDQLGPIKGFASLNPYSSARKLQANVDLVRQRVGKALEGGVLRKEDEEKYKKILATLNDTPSTAEYKIDALISSVQRDIDTYTGLQKTGGRSADVNAPLAKKGTTTSKPDDLRKKYDY